MMINDLITMYKNDIAENGKRLEDCFQRLEEKAKSHNASQCQAIMDEINFLSTTNHLKKHLLIQLMALDKRELQK